MAAVQHEGQATLCQPSCDAEVAVSQAILEVQNGGGKVGLTGDAQTLGGICRSAHIGTGVLQDHLKAACDKGLALNDEDRTARKGSLSHDWSSAGGNAPRAFST
jgi:hypothetical protein